MLYNTVRFNPAQFTTTTVAGTLAGDSSLTDFSAMTVTPVSGLVRLTSITDALGNETTFTYSTNPDEDPLLIRSIIDPFNSGARHADIKYDGNGRLYSIRDAENMKSHFTYGPTAAHAEFSADFINSMTTPYETTTFAGGGVSGSGQSNRWLNVTDEQGKTERTQFLIGGIVADTETYSPSTVSPYWPTAWPVSLANYWLYWRNTFYWDKQSYEQNCPAGNCAYNKAVLMHWLHANSVAYGVLESIKKPLESRIWFTYPGQTGGTAPGSMSVPRYVGRVLDDGVTTQRTLIYRNPSVKQGKPTQVTDPEGQTLYYTYSDDGVDLLKVSRVSNGATWLDKYEYNDAHLPVSHIDALGNETTYDYVAGNPSQLWKITNADGKVITYSYYADSDSNHAARGKLHTITDSANGVDIVTYTYDAAGQVLTSTNANNYTLTYTHDALDRLKTITYPGLNGSANTVQEITYDNLDVNVISDRLGDTKTLIHDNSRNVSAVSIKRATTETLHEGYSYYPNGTLKTVLDGNNNLTKYEIDDQSRVTHIKRGGTGTTEGTNDTQYIYETNTSRLHKVIDPAGGETVYEYDKADRIISVDDANPNNSNTIYHYNGYGQLDSIDSPDSGVTTFPEYDVAGNLKKKKLAAGTADEVEINYSYDSLNRPLTITHSGGAADTSKDVVYTWDDNCAGQYDHGYVIGRLCRVTRGTGTTASIIDYKYNKLGQVLVETKQPKGSAGPSVSIAYGYNDAGDLISATYPGGRTVTYPNTAGRMTAINTPIPGSASTALISDIGYRPFAGIKKFKYANTGSGQYVNERNFDLNGRLSNLTLTDANNDAVVRTYGYDNFNNINSITMPATGDTEGYTFDALQRLETATGSYGKLEYSYDPVGNRKQLIKSEYVVSTPGSAAVMTPRYTEDYLYEGQTEPADNKTSNRLEKIKRTAPDSSPIRERTFTHDTRGNVQTDRRDTCEAPNAQKQNQTLTLDHGKANRLDAVVVSSDPCE